MDLTALEPLIGSWTTTVVLPPGGGEPVRGRTTFAWLERGGYVVQRASMEDPRFPTGVMVLGPSYDGDGFAQHYFDSRGVARIYELTLADGVLRLARDHPGFSQRFTGQVSDGRIEGAWEKDEGAGWVHDFDLTYVRE